MTKLLMKPKHLTHALSALRLPIYCANFLMLASIPAFAIDPNALPQNGSIVGGAGSISSSSNQMRVVQNSQNMIVNWNSFNIGKDASVNFVQPSSQSSVLNRVASADPSYIMGNLRANGRVFLVNPSGVMFGNGAQVDVGSLVASTLDISNSNFMSGNYVFEKNGIASSVINQGNLKADNGGFIAMLAPEVINQGLITARLGSVALAAGDKVSLDIKGGGLLSFNIDKAALTALAENRGLIQANGGQVILGARSAGDLMATVVNNSGVIEANSFTEKNGTIVLDGGPQGIIKNQGTLAAIGSGSGQTGGSVKVLGDKVGLTSGSLIDASGGAGGGEILIGGNYQGKGVEPNASFTHVEQGTSIKANALDGGNGGKVIVWANDATRFNGAIESKGGAKGGDGGFVEVSGKRYLGFNGSVDTRAPKGRVGTLLLDPENVTISAVSSTSNMNSTGSPFSPTGDNATLSVSNLVTQLGLSDTIINTGSTGGQSGTITLSPSSPITWTNGNSLTFAAANSVTILSPITSTGAAGVNGGNFTVNAGNTVLINSSITTTGGTGSNTSGGNISINTTAGGITISPGVSLNSSGNNGGGGVNHSAGSITLSAGPSSTLTTGSGGATISALGYNGGTGNAISLTADSMVINGGLYADRINFSTKTASQNISLGPTGGGLLLTDTIAANTYAPNIYISTGSGNIVHTGDFTPAASYGGVFSVMTGSGTITDTTGGASSLGPGGNASNYILSGASIGASGSPIITSHSPILSLTSAGDIYVRGDAATGLTNSLSVNSSSGGTGVFNFTNITNAVPSITTSGNVYTVSGTNAGSAMSFAFTGNAPVNVGTGATGLASNGGNLAVSATGTGSNISVLTGGGGVITSGAGSATLDAAGNLTVNNNVNAGSGGIGLTGASGITYNAGTIQTANNGSISFNSATTLGTPLTTNSGSGNTSFMSSIAGGANALVVNSTGTTLFNSTVGAASLTTNAGGTTQLNGSVTTSSTQIYNDAVVVKSGVTLTTTDSALSFASTIDGQAGAINSLAASTGSGAITVVGTIGGTQALGSLALNSSAGSAPISIPSIGLTSAGVSDFAAIGNSSTTTLTLNGTSYNTGGAQTYTAAAGQNIILAGGAATSFTSNNAAISFNRANIQLGNSVDLTVNSNGGAISALKIDGTSSEDLTLNASAGNISVGAIGTQTANGINTVALTGLGGVALNGNITTDNLTGNSVNIVGPATLGTPVAINTANGLGNVVFSSTINGAQSLAITAGTANVELAGIAGGTSALAQVTANGSNIVLNGVKTTGIQTYTAPGRITANGSFISAGSAITFAGNSILNGNTSVDTTNGGSSSAGENISFNGILNSDGVVTPSSLGLAAGASGDITFNGVVGGINSLGAVSVSSAKNITVPAFTASSLTQLSGTGITNLNGLVTTTGKVDLTGTAFTVSSGINAGGYVAFVNSGLLTTTSNITTGAAGFRQSGSGLNSIGGNITTASGDIGFLTGVTLTTDVLLTSGTGGTGNTTLSSTVNGAKSLVINTGGTTTFGGLVGGTSALTSITTDAPGATAINGGGASTTAAQTYNDTVTLGANTILNGVNVTFASTVNGASSLKVNDSGTTTFGGLVGGTIALSSITTDAPGATAINGGGASTTAAQTYNDVVTLGANTVLNGVNVTFASTVNGARNLTVNDSGSTTFGGVVGGTSVLTSVTTDALGTTAINGGVVNTSAAQTYNDAVTLGANTVLNGVNVTLGSTVNGARSLAVNDSGTTTFGGLVGGTSALTSITTDAPGTTAINGRGATTTAAQTYNDVVTLGVNDVLNGVNVTFASTINGANSLTVNDGGQTLLIGQIGQLNPLVNLTVNTAGGLVLPKTTLTGNMSLTTGGAVTQIGSAIVGGTTHINAGLNPITLTNAANDFVGVVGSLDGTSVGLKGTVISLVDVNNMNLGQIAATAGAITINAGGSIYNGLPGVTNITSTTGSILRANGGVVGTISTPVTVNLPMVTTNSTKEQGGVSVDLTGHVGDNMIWLIQTPPGLVFLNGMIMNAGQVPGVPQDAYSTALGVLDQTYLTSNGIVLNTKPYSTVNADSESMYPTDSNNKAFTYGPDGYKLPGSVKLKDGGLKLPSGLQVSSVKK